MWDWLQAYKVPFYDTFWNLQGLEEYKKIYSKSINEELKDRNITEKEVTEIEEIIQQQFKNVSYHFGDPHLNVVTIAGIYRMALKEYDQRHGIETKKEIKPHINIGEYL